MNFALRNTPLLALALLLAGCGPPLGTYHVDEITLVPAITLARIAGQAYTGPERFLIRVKFTSTTNVEEASGGGDLYVHGDFCPFKERYRLGLIGPFHNDRPRLLSTKVTSYKKLPDGRVRMSIKSINRVPEKDSRSGKFIYTAYLIPSAPKDQFAEAYSLRGRSDDICLRIEHPGYYLTNSQSKVFKIEGSLIHQALAGLS